MKPMAPRTIASRLVGFDTPYGCYDDPAAVDEDGALAWPQWLGWEVREVIVESVSYAIAAETPERIDYWAINEQAEC